MSIDYMLECLKAGGGPWDHIKRQSVAVPITLGPRKFPSQDAAQQYVRQIMSFCPPGQEIAGDDALILTDMVKWSKHYKHIEKHGILGFTVKDPPRGGNRTEMVKILVVLLASVTGRFPRTRLLECDVSIQDCFDNMQQDKGVSNVNVKRVFRQELNGRGSLI